MTIDFNNQSSKTFQIDVTKGVFNGNIAVLKGNGNNSDKANINFTNSSTNQFQGDLTNKNGKAITTMKFGESINTGSKTSITNSITGDITTYDGASTNIYFLNNEGTNTITGSNGNTTTGSEPDSLINSGYNGAKTTIIFGSEKENDFSTQKNEIDKLIGNGTTSITNGNTNGNTNSITANTTNTIKVKNIWTRPNGTTNIFFKNNGSNTIEGNMKLNQGGNINIISLGGTNTIKGSIGSTLLSIDRDKSTMGIFLKGNKNYIESSLSDFYYGKLGIILDNESSNSNANNGATANSSKIKANIKNEGDGSKFNILFKGNSDSTIEGDITTRSPYSTKNTTTITFDSSAANAIIGNITNDNTTTINMNKGTNSITGNIGTYTGGKTTITAKSNLSISGGNIGTYNSGTTTITANSNLSIDGNIDTNAGTTTINMNQGTNSITGKIDTYNRGTTTITAKSKLGITGNIDTNNGTLTITSQNDTSSSPAKTSEISSNITGNIKVAGGGTAANTITLKDQSNVIVGNISAEGYGTNKNNITLEGPINKIIGNIITNVNAGYGDRGSNNIKITSTNMSNNTGASVIAGNITTNGGSNNIILENAIWAPINVDKSKLPGDVSVSTASGFLTTNRGTTNIVLRQDASNVGSAMIDKQPLYSVTTNGGTTNIVMQGPINIGANIQYGASGTTNLIFANSNDGGTKGDSATTLATTVNDDFATTDVNANKVLGVTYQDGIKLSLADKQVSVGSQSKSFLDTYSHYFDDMVDNALLNITANRSNSSGTQTDVAIIKGLAAGDITTLANATNAKQTTTYNYNITLDSNSAFVGNIDLKDNSNVTLTMRAGSKLLTDSEKLKLSHLTLNSNSFDNSQILYATFAQNNTIIDIASMGNDLGSIPTRTNFRLLEIGSTDTKDGAATTGIEGGNALFRVYMNAGADQSKATLGGAKTQKEQTDSTYGHLYSDRIIIYSNATSSSSNNYIQVIADSSTDINNISYHGGGSETAGNVAVATVKKDSNITFTGATQIQGFDEVGTTLVQANTDQYGKVNTGSDTSNDYTTYFVGSMVSKGASNANQNASISAMGSNYQLFLANLNSLNKRMGELRDNPKGQGVWARIFTGLQTSKFALQTNSYYTTIQGGYDYAFGFNGANNYLGFAISYINSINSSAKNLDIDASYKGINTSISNGIELAIYNAYVQDGASSATGWKNGLYTDSIIKFSLMYNSLTLLNQNNEYSIDNFAFSISQEVGYRFILGQSNEWYIDPQAELTFGYFDQSKLHQVIGASYLDGIQDSIITLRGRVGSSFGYKFDKFTENFKAQAYLGTYFVGDYIAGGDISLTSNLNKTISLKPLSSTARFTMNLGTNIAIKDDHRIYFDFERSFGGSIITQYQFNLGYRYSFGESKYTPYSGVSMDMSDAKDSIKEVAPTQGYYIKLLSTKKASKKELRVLKGINNLKTQNNGDSKSYLIGPFKSVDEAKGEKSNYEGVLKELGSEGEIIEVE